MYDFNAERFLKAFSYYIRRLSNPHASLELTNKYLHDGWWKGKILSEETASEFAYYLTKNYGRLYGRSEGNRIKLYFLLLYSLYRRCDKYKLKKMGTYNLYNEIAKVVDSMW